MRVSQERVEEIELTEGVDEFVVLGVWPNVTDEEGNLLGSDAILTDIGILYFTNSEDMYSEKNKSSIKNNFFQRNKDLSEDDNLEEYLADTYLYQRFEANLQSENIMRMRKSENQEVILKNIWVMEVAEDKALCFFEGKELSLYYKSKEDGFPKTAREQINDIVFKEGMLESVNTKTEKVNGKLLSVREDDIELANAGVLSFAEDYKIYRLHDTLELGSLSDLTLGYDFADFVLEDGKVCAVLLTRTGEMKNIRVLIKTTDFVSNYHEKIEITTDSPVRIICGNNEASADAGSKIVIDANKDSEFFVTNRMYIIPDVLTSKMTLTSVERNQGFPSYRGAFEIEKTEEGLLLVNELLLEEYLYAVVPSEMPSLYPIEALKAQSVCARTFAYTHMLASSLAAYGAHVDDSVSYQVYNNIEENAETTKAVKDTKGQILYADEMPANTYYYSTSCGYGTNADVWKGGNGQSYDYLQSKNIGTNEVSLEMTQEEIFREYIMQVHDTDFESEEGWYRWTFASSFENSEELRVRLQKRYEINKNLILMQTKEGEFESKEIDNLGEIKDIYVPKRGDGGVIDELIIEGEKNTVKVISELNVRYVLADGVNNVVRQDGTQGNALSMLPSAFFMIEPSIKEENVVGYFIIGGGYGHGVGMSQNGAKCMADKDYKKEEILEYFYEGATIEVLYE